jgi:hypothetical protein
MDIMLCGSWFKILSDDKMKFVTNGTLTSGRLL